MKTPALALLSLALIVPLTACNKLPGGSSPPAAPVPTATVSPEAKPPATPAATMAPANTEKATGSTLTADEKNTKSPLPGQVNDHSTAVPAKKGDDTKPASK